MEKLSKLFCIMSLIIFSSVASAGLLIEPQIGYNVHGKMDTITGTSAGVGYTADSTNNGPQYGARLGYTLLGVMGGFSYNHATYTNKLTVVCASLCGTTTYDNKAKRDDLGIFVGYKAPLLLRGWLGYSFSSKETATNTTTFQTSGDWNKGHATEIGLGFTGLPIVNLNAIYRMITFTKNNAGTLTSDVKAKEIVLAVSAPFDL